MAEEKKKGRRKQPKRTYVHRPNAVHITVYSVDGQPVPKKVLEEAATAVQDVAFRNNLLIGLAET